MGNLSLEVSAVFVACFAFPPIASLIKSAVLDHSHSARSGPNYKQAAAERGNDIDMNQFGNIQH